MTNHSLSSSVAESSAAPCPSTEPVDETRLVTVLIGAPFGLAGILTNGLLMFLFGGSKYRSVEE